METLLDARAHPIIISLLLESGRKIKFTFVRRCPVSTRETCEAGIQSIKTFSIKEAQNRHTFIVRGINKKIFPFAPSKRILTNFQPQLNKSKTFSEKIKYVSIATSKPLKDFPQGRVVFIAWGGEGFSWAEEYHGSQKEREGRSVVANRV